MGMGLGQNAGTMLSHLLFDGTDGCSFDLFDVPISIAALFNIQRNEFLNWATPSIQWHKTSCSHIVSPFKLP